MPNNIEYVNSVKRHFDETPTIVNQPLAEECTLENSIMEGFATIIIDKKFLDEIRSLITEEDLKNNQFIELITLIHNRINHYFYTSDERNSREETYAENHVIDSQGEIQGTKLSSLKGKNVAQCSEKSIAAYAILEDLYMRGLISRQPSLVLSFLRTETTSKTPHAFITIDKDDNEYPLKHILFDVENPTTLEKKETGQKYRFVGLYALTDEEYEHLQKGIECSPTSLFEHYYTELNDIDEKRIYGSKQPEITLN